MGRRHARSRVPNKNMRSGSGWEQLMNASKRRRRIDHYNGEHNKHGAIHIYIYTYTEEERDTNINRNVLI